ncbi:transcription repressor OFP15-like [Salvia miltiorrhiza]|uniref:transcription repressor OFP15-like n=1 Tax=Salvia miltiorrhiza TaxID=226208 RepID=UPI0025AD8D1B|nr:transcription repressor OFP15-like [Salvia miltiorrhiza]
MGKKKKFPFLFKATDSPTTSAASPWPWPACVNSPKTLSFRANANSNIYKTINSAYLDDEKATAEFTETPDSFFSIRRDESFSSAAASQVFPDETAVIGGLRSDRLFFEPGETNSILEEAAKARAFPYSGGGVKIMAMDSDDPFLDFRSSMAEMVVAHGIKRWECLEELLTCYLRVNEKGNHGYIVGAFVDLLIHLSLQAAPLIDSASAADEHCSSSTSTTTHYSFTSPLSFSSSSTYSSTSPGLSMLENEDEIAGEKIPAG